MTTVELPALRSAPEAAATPAKIRECAPLGASLAGPWQAVGDNADAADPLSRAWHLETALVVRQACEAQRLHRRRADAMSDQLDHYQLLVSLSGGPIEAELDGRRVAARRGEPLVLDLAESAVVTIGSGEYVSAFFPRERLDELLDAPSMLHGAVLQGASALVLAEHLRSLTACLSGLGVAQAPHAAAATLHIAAAALSSLPADAAPRRPSVCLLLRQACRYIELHLDEPELCAGDLCRAFRASRATVYRLFERFGGVSAHIRERRLARIHELLVHGDHGHPNLASLAEAHGILDAAHFSRIYRRHFGHSPSQAAEHAHATLPAAGAAPTASTLHAWLLALRG